MTLGPFKSETYSTLENAKDSMFLTVPTVIYFLVLITTLNAYVEYFLKSVQIVSIS